MMGPARPNACNVVHVHLADTKIPEPTWFRMTETSLKLPYGFCGAVPPSPKLI